MTSAGAATAAVTDQASRPWTCSGSRSEPAATPRLSRIDQKPATLSTYRRLVEQRIVPALGSTPLADLSTGMLSTPASLRNSWTADSRLQAVCTAALPRNHENAHGQVRGPAPASPRRSAG